jgi:aerobic-type carbon monoxide dehydrogenase small subunit (CoxS/CutS family)
VHFSALPEKRNEKVIGMSRLVDIHLVVNGKAREGRCEPRMLLVDFLRDNLGLTGTHAGCEHGICGACTILYNGEAARSCIMLAVQADGSEIVTVEGMARDGKMHPLQQAFHEHHGLQCGFCTPGMLIAAMDFLQTNPSPNEDEVREGLSAVLCRCTGYQNIVAAVMAAAAHMRSGQA